MTAISPRVVQQLGLKPISFVTVHYGNESADSPVYKVDVLLPNRVVVGNVNASQAKNIQGADVLIGMDVITTGDFAVTNANGITCFSFRFPSALDHTDYAAEADKIRKQRENRDKTRRLGRKGKLK